MEAVNPNLIARAAGGDVKALEHLLRFFHEDLFDYIERQMPADLKSVFDPQDIVHDTCFEAFRRIGDFSAGDADSTRRWLKTIARHKLLDLIKSQRRAKRGGGRRAERRGDRRRRETAGGTGRLFANPEPFGHAARDANRP